MNLSEIPEIIGYCLAVLSMSCGYGAVKGILSGDWNETFKFGILAAVIGLIAKAIIDN